MGDVAGHAAVGAQLTESLTVLLICVCRETKGLADNIDTGSTTVSCLRVLVSKLGVVIHERASHDKETCHGQHYPC